ncbi:MAG: hypothetical protein GY765_32005 [bacterium]|nr:hypothetical protein [bacterium]
MRDRKKHMGINSRAPKPIIKGDTAPGIKKDKIKNIYTNVKFDTLGVSK